MWLTRQSVTGFALKPSNSIEMPLNFIVIMYANNVFESPVYNKVFLYSCMLMPKHACFRKNLRTKDFMPVILQWFFYKSLLKLIPSLFCTMIRWPYKNFGPEAIASWDVYQIESSPSFSQNQKAKPTNFSLDFEGEQEM